MCLKSTNFSYGGNFYEQKESAVMSSPVSTWWPTPTWSFLKSWHWRWHRQDPGCGRGMLMTLDVHCGTGRRWDTPFATQERRAWQPGCLCLQEANMHTDWCLHFEFHHLTHAKSGVEMSLWQGHRDQHTRGTTFRRQLTTLLEFSRRTVTLSCKLYLQRLYPTHTLNSKHEQPWQGTAKGMWLGWMRTSGEFAGSSASE